MRFLLPISYPQAGQGGGGVVRGRGSNFIQSDVTGREALPSIFLLHSCCCCCGPPAFTWGGSHLALIGKKKARGNDDDDDETSATAAWMGTTTAAAATASSSWTTTSPATSAKHTAASLGSRACHSIKAAADLSHPEQCSRVRHDTSSWSWEFLNEQEEFPGSLCSEFSQVGGAERKRGRNNSCSAPQP